MRCRRSSTPSWSRSAARACGSRSRSTRTSCSRAARAAFAPAAAPVLDKLADVLKPFPNPIRVEGHTDDRPIKTAAFPSNWELSAARSASVVHEFTKAGIDPLRLEIVGFGEFHPRQSNETAEGRNANRRVAILVLEAVAPGAPVTATADGDGRPRPRRGRNGRCGGRGKSATMARAALGFGKDRIGEGSSEDGGATDVGGEGGAGTAVDSGADSVSEVTHGRSRSLEQFRALSRAADRRQAQPQGRIRWTTAGGGKSTDKRPPPEAGGGRSREPGRPPKSLIDEYA